MNDVLATGLSLITPLGHDLDVQIKKMYAGTSAISKWTRYPTDNIFAKIGGDLGSRSPSEHLQEIFPLLPEAVARKAKRLLIRVPWSTAHSIELALRACLNAGVFPTPEDAHEWAVIVAGTNINPEYMFQQSHVFAKEPDHIDAMAGLVGLDTDHAGCISEVLGIKGGAYVVGGACASGNMAVRAAFDEIHHHDIKKVLVVGAVYTPAALDLHSLAIMRAISVDSFNEQPEKASRPFDTRREGFIPAHGGAGILFESSASALDRKAHVYGELLGAELSSDGNHLPQPSKEGQVRALKRLLQKIQLQPQDVQYINAHATSTPQGDLVEMEALVEVFGDHTKNLKINAPKSMLGHTCWSSAIVETVTSFLQMRDSQLYPSINVENMDPAIPVPIVTEHVQNFKFDTFIKNSFGFGGLNCVAAYRKWSPK